jgi:hypothetical protein
MPERHGQRRAVAHFTCALPAVCCSGSPRRGDFHDGTTMAAMWQKLGLGRFGPMRPAIGDIDRISSGPSAYSHMGSGLSPGGERVGPAPLGPYVTSKPGRAE